MLKNNYQWKNLVHNENNSNINEKQENKHIIEYIDVNESDTLMIAMTQDNLKENSKENYA